MLKTGNSFFSGGNYSDENMISAGTGVNRGGRIVLDSAAGFVEIGLVGGRWERGV